MPRSVFDDDFFQSTRRDTPGEPTATTPEPPTFGNQTFSNPGPDTRMPSARGFDSPDTHRPLRVHFTESSAEYGVPEPTVRTPAFTGAVAPEPAESDELDIPAFLRRGH